MAFWQRKDVKLFSIVHLYLCKIYINVISWFGLASCFEYREFLPILALKHFIGVARRTKPRIVLPTCDTPKFEWIYEVQDWTKRKLKLQLHFAVMICCDTKRYDMKAKYKILLMKCNTFREKKTNCRELAFIRVIQWKAIKSGVHQLSLFEPKSKSNAEKNHHSTVQIVETIHLRWKNVTQKLWLLAKSQCQNGVYYKSFTKISIKTVQNRKMFSSSVSL